MAKGEFLSTLGLYHFDSTLFDEFVIPTQITASKQDLIDRICLETAELEVLLPNPLVFKKAIGVWSRLCLDKWQKMADVLYKQNYNPFENVDREEVRTFDLATSDDNTRTLDYTDKNTRDLTDTTQMESYDSSTWQDRSKLIQGGTDTLDHDGTIKDEGDGTKTGTVTTTNKGLSTFYSAPDSKIRIVRSEVEMRMEYDLESIILQEFKNEFCLQVY